MTRSATPTLAATAVRDSATGSARRFALPRVLRQMVMAVISIGTLLLLWHLSSKYVFNAVLIATPEQTFATAWEMMKTGELFRHIGVSLLRVLIGYIIGCFFGIVLGALIGRIRLIRELADPVLELIRPISPVAIVPLAMLWFGIGEMSKYVVILYATVIVMVLNTAAGVARAPVTRIRAARSLGANEYQVFAKVMFPSAMPFILTGMRVALGFSFMGIVAAELIGAREGIGFLIMNSRQLMNTEQLFVGLLSLGVVGAIIDRLFRSVLDRYTRRYMQFQREV
jgi:ABC-type nitrate/sulfonate/bicarbonate transport system permease component